MDIKNTSDIKTISTLTLGCSRNVVDSERIIGGLEANGFIYKDSADGVDALIINTCGFIEPAKEESIKVILDAAEMKKAGKLKTLIVTGCLSERYYDDLYAQIPDVDYFFGVASEEKILKVLSGDRKYTLLGERSVLTPEHYAYLKISEGCNHKCSFCAIPLMRGRHNSYSIEKLVDETKSLVSRGASEIIVTAEDTTYYGKDLYGKRNIAELLDRLSDVEGVKRLRLMYAYPTNFPKDVLKLIASKDNICSYIDMPFQHANDNLLKSMKRGITRQEITDIVHEIRTEIPQAHIRSTFIVGYPGEGENEFTELLDFLSEVQLDRVGAFRYSREEDTSAHILGDPVKPEIKTQRLEKLMMLQQNVSIQKNRKKIGDYFEVIIDSIKDGLYIGRTEYDAPEVDNGVIFTSDKKHNKGDYVRVKITDAEEYDLRGNAI